MASIKTDLCEAQMALEDFRDSDLNLTDKSEREMGEGSKKE